MLIDFLFVIPTQNFEIMEFHLEIFFCLFYQSDTWEFQGLIETRIILLNRQRNKSSSRVICLSHFFSHLRILLGHCILLIINLSHTSINISVHNIMAISYILDLINNETYCFSQRQWYIIPSLWCDIFQMINVFYTHLTWILRFYPSLWTKTVLWMLPSLSSDHILWWAVTIFVEGCFSMYQFLFILWNLSRFLW